MSRKPENKTMKQLLEANTSYGTRRISQVFRDFCELSALAIRNSVDLSGRDDREQQYLQIVSGYTQEESARFAELLAKLTMELDVELSDVLGHLYMSLDLGNEEMGQFFTPYHVSQVIAQMNCPDFSALLAKRKFITVSEPTCGSGGMIVAMADAMRAAGSNYQQQLHVTAQDIERTSVHMTYIALSLLHIPAVVIHGNTLTMEVRDRWFTPAHVLGGWSDRLRIRAQELAVSAAQIALVDPIICPSGNDESMVTAVAGLDPDEPAKTLYSGSGNELNSLFVH